MKLSKDKTSGDYNPFYNGEDNIYDKPLTLEEMKSKGYVSCEYKMDIENGYFAWVYSSSPCGCGRGCMKTSSSSDNHFKPIDVDQGK